METKITTASVRIALSHNYSIFEVALNLENEQGISPSEIEKARVHAQQLALGAVNDYKGTITLPPKEELQRVQTRLNEISKLVDKKEKPVDPKEVQQIESLPLYQPKKVAKDKPIKKPVFKNTGLKTPNDIMGLGADD